MKAEIRYRPSFAAIFLCLNPGEKVIAESDAMASMSTHVRMRTRFNGGFFTAILRRLLGQESLFVNEFSCDPSATTPAELVLSQPTPGDIARIDLQNNTFYL